MAKLLLVEDDNNLREIYEARLSAEGYDITTAQNGEEALSVAKSVHPDLIISDVMMPRISGFEMLDILRNTDELKNTKIIMLTALGQAEDRGRADNLGADKYLVKSQVTLEDIVKAAEELLSDSAAGAAAQPAPATDVPSAPVAATPAPEPQVAAPVAEIPAPVTASVSLETPVQADVAESVDTAVAEEITAPAPTEPAVAVEPLAAPSVPESAPVTQEPTTVTVVDPDPITAAAETVPAAESTIPDTSQSLAAEEEAIQQQIASFAATTEPAPQVTEPAAAPAIPTPASVANDAVLAQAMSDLTSTTSDPVNDPAAAPAPIPTPNPMPDPTPVPAPTPQPDANNDVLTDSQQVTGRKVIQPLDSTTNVGTAPDLQTLLAAEDAKEAVNTAVPTPSPAPTLATPAAEEPRQMIDPNTIAL